MNIETLQPAPSGRNLDLLLPDHHLRLEQACLDLLGAAYADDPRELVERWRELEVEILDHIAAEEEMIIPAYAAFAPEHARQILDDHAKIRELAVPLGVAVELHEMRAERLRLLVDAIRAHARYEEATMYPWACRNLSQAVLRQLFVRISKWFRGQL